MREFLGGETPVFPTPDPLTTSYAQLTPYQFASNSPIAGIDKDGLEFELYYTKFTGDIWQPKLSVGTHVDNYDAVITLKGSINTTVSLSGTPLNHTFSKSFSIDLSYSLLGLHPVAVDHNGEWLVLPDDGINKNDLPSTNDPIWSSFETIDRFQARTAEKLNSVLQTIKNVESIGQAVYGLGNLIKSGDVSGKKVNLESNSERAKHLKQLEKGRPERYRKGVVEEVWDNAKKAGGGKVIDAKSRQEIIWDSKGKKPRNWDMGHIEGKEYYRLKQDYIDGKITWKQYLNEYNNPANYKPENKGPNRADNQKKPN